MSPEHICRLLWLQPVALAKKHFNYTAPLCSRSWWNNCSLHLILYCFNLQYLEPAISGRVVFLEVSIFKPSVLVSTQLFQNMIVRIVSIESPPSFGLKICQNTVKDNYHRFAKPFIRFLCLVGGWTTQLKSISQISWFPQGSGWKYKMFELPPPSFFLGGKETDAVDSSIGTYSLPPLFHQPGNMGILNLHLHIFKRNWYDPNQRTNPCFKQRRLLREKSIYACKEKTYILYTYIHT